MRKKKSAKKMYKKGKNIVVDLPPTQIQSVGVDCSLLGMAFQGSVSKTKRYTKRCDNGGGVEKRGRLCNYLHI